MIDFEPRCPELLFDLLVEDCLWLLGSCSLPFEQTQVPLIKIVYLSCIKFTTNLCCFFSQVLNY